MTWWYENEEEKMEFDKSRVFSAVNADELRAGDKVILANTMANLREDVERGVNIQTLREVHGEDCLSRFIGKDGWYPLAYLYEKGENCTNCEGCEYQNKEWMKKNKDYLINRCENYKPKTEQKAEEKNCYNCRLTYTRDGVMRCMMNDQRCNNPEVACNHYEPTTFEKHYRPFRDTDELIKVWDAKYRYAYGLERINNGLDMPLIWVRRKEANTKGQLITEFGDGWGVGVGRGEAYNMTDLLVHFTFLDGSPCGVEE